jgi:hypothetical protein
MGSRKGVAGICPARDIVGLFFEFCYTLIAFGFLGRSLVLPEETFPRDFFGKGGEI